jgi:hypothetical protein
VAVAAVVASRQHTSTARPLAHGQLLTASANIFPQSFLFGDPVHIRIDAVIDHRKLDPAKIRLETTWSPYTPIESMVETRSDAGGYTVLHWSVDVHCVVVPCVPQVGSTVRHVFEPTTVRYAGRASGGVKPRPVTIIWPELIALSRLDPIDAERKALVQRLEPVHRRQLVAFAPPWHLDSTNLAAVSYRVSPTTVLWAAVALALGLVLAAAALLRPYLPAVAIRGRRGREQSRLERALDLVERTRGGEATDERKALELLAAELRRSGRKGLAWTATELAWSPVVPAPERTAALTDRVRRELAGRTNGRLS